MRKALPLISWSALAGAGMDAAWLGGLVTVAVPRGWILMGVVWVAYFLERTGRWPLIVHFGIAAILGFLAYVLYGMPLAVGMAVLAEVWGLSARMASPYRRVTWAILMGVLVAVVNAHLWWLAWTIVALGTFHLAWELPLQGIGGRVRSGLVALVAIASLAAAAVITGILWIIPWAWIIENTAGRVAAGLVRLIPVLHLRMRHPTTSQPVKTGHPPHVVHSQHPTEAILLGIAIAIIVFGGIWVLWRMLRTMEQDSDSREEEGFIIREKLADRQDRLTFGAGRALPPVRNAVRHGLRRFGGKNLRRLSGETFRQWFARVYGKVGQSVTIYESVRYGQEPDTSERARIVEQQWPREVGKKI